MVTETKIGDEIWSQLESPGGGGFKETCLVDFFTTKTGEMKVPM